MKKALSLSMAVLTAVSSTVCVYAEANTQESKALKEALTVAKSRLTIPEELSEFNYSHTNLNMTDSYRFTWSDPANGGSISCTVVGSVITSYYSREVSEESKPALAKLSGDKLYKKAEAAVKMLNPTIAKNIAIDRDSLNISLYGNSATFSLVRTRKGIPVQNDSGMISINKDTGELISFNINWHTKASFKNAEGILTETQAKDAYADMIALTPRYELNYNYETERYEPQLVYVQSNYGRINAFTGKKSDFTTDGYYSDSLEEEIATDNAAPESGNLKNEVTFTPQELEEINKELPYNSEEEIVALIKDSKYLTYIDGMELTYSNINKQK